MLFFCSLNHSTLSLYIYIYFIAFLFQLTCACYMKFLLFCTLLYLPKTNIFDDIDNDLIEECNSLPSFVDTDGNREGSERVHPSQPVPFIKNNSLYHPKINLYTSCLVSFCLSIVPFCIVPLLVVQWGFHFLRIIITRTMVSRISSTTTTTFASTSKSLGRYCIHFKEWFKSSWMRLVIFHQKLFFFFF